MRALARSLGIGAVVACSLAVALAGSAGQTRSRAARNGAMATGAGPADIVPQASLLVTDLTGRMFVMSRSGQVLRRIPGSLGPAVQALELSPDRRHAYASTYLRNGGLRLYDLDLATGHKRALVRAAFGPALNPAQTQLAYVTISFASGIPFARALVVRDLRTQQVHSIPLAQRVVVGTPPELIINWSPDGRRIAIFDGHRIRLVDVATAPNVHSQPAVPEPPDRSGQPPFYAPVYLDAHHVVVDTNCCIHDQHLAAINVLSGARRAFATLSSPPQNLLRLRSGELLVEDALSELAIVTRGHVHVIANHIAAAAA